MTLPSLTRSIAAAENGKQVTAVVELRAWFDEKNNITSGPGARACRRQRRLWFVGLKTHELPLSSGKKRRVSSATCMVATGNYNSSTAKLYTDICFFTANEGIGCDIATMFNLINRIRHPHR